MARMGGNFVIVIYVNYGKESTKVLCFWSFWEFVIGVIQVSGGKMWILNRKKFSKENSNVEN